jgi:hypothetical protein
MFPSEGMKHLCKLLVFSPDLHQDDRDALRTSTSLSKMLLVIPLNGVIGGSFARIDLA